MNAALHISDLVPVVLAAAGFLAVLIACEKLITWWDRRATQREREAYEQRKRQAHILPQVDDGRDPRRLQLPANDPNAEQLPWSRSGGNFWPEGIIPPEDRRP